MEAEQLFMAKEVVGAGGLESAGPRPLIGLLAIVMEEAMVGVGGGESGEVPGGGSGLDALAWGASLAGSCSCSSAFCACC